MYSYVEGDFCVDFNISGFNSSFIGELILDVEICEWFNIMIVWIKLLQLIRIWEIGCGFGLILFCLVFFCQFYLGMDILEEIVQ